MTPQIKKKLKDPSSVTLIKILRLNMTLNKKLCKRKKFA